MQLLGSLNVGARFRVAHPRQPSLNGRMVPRSLVLRVAKVYAMAPYTTIAMASYYHWPQDIDKGFFSLGPGTPVLLPREPDPTEAEVLQFLSPRVGRPRVVAYRLLWDGKLELAGLVPPQAIAIVKLLFSVGKSEYRVDEVNKLLRDHYWKFYHGYTTRSYTGIQVLKFYCRHLVNQGLVEEVVDRGPAPQAIRDANLQEAE